MKIIYESVKPKFAISKDKFQWILSSIRTKRGEWTNHCYFPKLSLLLDELAEQQFRNSSIKIKELKDLDKRINAVYGLIIPVREVLEKRFSEGFISKDDN